MPSWVPTYLPLVLVAIGGVTMAVNLQRDVQHNSTAIINQSNDQVGKWAAHTDYHREKAVENQGLFSRIDERLVSVEQLSPKVDQITYRTTVLEQQAVSTSNAIKELQTTINSLSADVRITVEILRRMEERDGGPVLSTPRARQ